MNRGVRAIRSSATDASAGELVRALSAARQLVSTDWSKLDESRRTLQQTLEQIAGEPASLRALLNCALTDPALRSMADQSPLGFRKLVLFADDRSGVRLRLHFTPGGYEDEPHNHRMTFGAMILAGGYEHTIYGPHTGAALPYREELQAAMVRHESSGSFYVLQHDVVHRINTAPGAPWTVSMFVKSPPFRRGAVNVNLKTGERWWHFGADEHASMVPARVPIDLTDDAIEEQLQVMIDHGLI